MTSSAKLTKEMAACSTSTDRRVTTVTIVTLEITLGISMKRNHAQQIVEKKIHWQRINFSVRDLWEI